MQISEDTLRWIKGWTIAETHSIYGDGYRDAMRDVLEEIEEDNDDISKDNSTQRSK